MHENRYLHYIPWLYTSLTIIKTWLYITYLQLSKHGYAILLHFLRLTLHHLPRFFMHAYVHVCMHIAVANADSVAKIAVDMENNKDRLPKWCEIAMKKVGYSLHSCPNSQVKYNVTIIGLAVASFFLFFYAQV